jgi:Uma2 family endonuclease
MALDEFIRLYDQEGPFELVEGERMPVVPTVMKQNLTTKRLFAAFLTYEQTHKVGEAFFEAPFVLTDRPDWVTGSRVPDVMFFRAERLAAYRATMPDWENKPMVLVPDLVVEIVSPGDSDTDVEKKKVKGYLRDGVRLVWVFNPQERGVFVHEAGGEQPTELTGDAVLSGSETMPGFEISIASVFE